MTFDAWKQQHATEIDWLSGLIRRLLKQAYDAGFQEGWAEKKGNVNREESQEEKT